MYRLLTKMPTLLFCVILALKLGRMLVNHGTKASDIDTITFCYWADSTEDSVIFTNCYLVTYPHLPQKFSDVFNYLRRVALVTSSTNGIAHMSFLAPIFSSKIPFLNALINAGKYMANLPFGILLRAFLYYALLQSAVHPFSKAKRTIACHISWRQVSPFSEMFCRYFCGLCAESIRGAKLGFGKMHAVVLERNTFFKNYITSFKRQLVSQAQHLLILVGYYTRHPREFLVARHLEPCLQSNQDTQGIAPFEISSEYDETSASTLDSLVFPDTPSPANFAVHSIVNAGGGPTDLTSSDEARHNSVPSSTSDVNALADELQAIVRNTLNDFQLQEPSFIFPAPFLLPETAEIAHDVHKTTDPVPVSSFSYNDESKTRLTPHPTSTYPSGDPRDYLLDNMLRSRQLSARRIISGDLSCSAPHNTTPPTAANEEVPVDIDLEIPLIQKTQRPADVIENYPEGLEDRRSFANEPVKVVKESFDDVETAILTIPYTPTPNCLSEPYSSRTTDQQSDLSNVPSLSSSAQIQFNTDDTSMGEAEYSAKVMSEVSMIHSEAHTPSSALELNQDDVCTAIVDVNATLSKARLLDRQLSADEGPLVEPSYVEKAQSIKGPLRMLVLRCYYLYIQGIMYRTSGSYGNATNRGNVVDEENMDDFYSYRSAISSAASFESSGSHSSASSSPLNTCLLKDDDTRSVRSMKRVLCFTEPEKSKEYPIYPGDVAKDLRKVLRESSGNTSETGELGLLALHYRAYGNSLRGVYRYPDLIYEEFAGKLDQLLRDQVGMSLSLCECYMKEVRNAVDMCGRVTVDFDVRPLVLLNTIVPEINDLTLEYSRRRREAIVDAQNFRAFVDHALASPKKAQYRYCMQKLKELGYWSSSGFEADVVYLQEMHAKYSSGVTRSRARHMADKCRGWLH